MGYTTDFKGHFVFNRPLDDETCKLLTGLAATRRVKRKFRQTDGYGIDGEFYCSDQEPIDQQTGKVIRNIVDDNEPPRTQPSLCLQWVPSADRKELHWDGGELKDRRLSCRLTDGLLQEKSSTATSLGLSICARRS